MLLDRRADEIYNIWLLPQHAMSNNRRNGYTLKEYEYVEINMPMKEKTESNSFGNATLKDINQLIIRARTGKKDIQTEKEEKERERNEDARDFVVRF